MCIASGLAPDFLAHTTLHYGNVTTVSNGSCCPHPQLVRAVLASWCASKRRLDEHTHWLTLLLTAPTSTTWAGAANA
jgi:hypothetical protein